MYIYIYILYIKQLDDLWNVWVCLSENGVYGTTSILVLEEHGNIMMDIDLLMDLDLRKVFPKLFQGYPILKWRVIKEECFFCGLFFFG